MCTTIKKIITIKIHKNYIEIFKNISGSLMLSVEDTDIYDSQVNDFDHLSRIDFMKINKVVSCISSKTHQHCAGNVCDEAVIIANILL